MNTHVPSTQSQELLTFYHFCFTYISSRSLLPQLDDGYYTLFFLRQNLQLSICNDLVYLIWLLLRDSMGNGYMSDFSLIL